MVEVLRSDYVTMARLTGTLPRILWKYALRNALAPSVQAFAQTAQYLVGGIVVVESVFAYPGIGTLLVHAVTARDTVASVALILAALTSRSTSSRTLWWSSSCRSCERRPCVTASLVRAPPRIRPRLSAVHAHGPRGSWLAMVALVVSWRCSDRSSHRIRRRSHRPPGHAR